MLEDTYTNLPNAFALLSALSREPLSAIYLKPGCDEIVIDRLQQSARLSLGGDIPEGFIRMLRFTNGLQVDSSHFTNASMLVAENLEIAYSPQIILLGNRGNVDDYIFDRKDRQYHVSSLGYPQERWASFPSFEELLLSILDELES